MCLISYLKKIKQRYRDNQLKRTIEDLKKAGFHTIRLDEKMKFSYINEKKVIEFEALKEAKDKKKAFISFAKTLDGIFGQHDEFEIDGCKVMFWKI